MLELHWVLNFFVLSTGYRNALLQEFYYLMKHLHIPWSDLLNMPTFERIFYINTLVEEFDKKKEAYEQAKNKKKQSY